MQQYMVVKSCDWVLKYEDRNRYKMQMFTDPVFEILIENFVCYYFRIKTFFSSSLSLVVCRRAHVLFMSFVFVCVQWCPTHIVLCFTWSCVPYVASLDAVPVPCLYVPLMFYNLDAVLMRHLYVPIMQYNLGAVPVPCLYVPPMFI